MKWFFSKIGSHIHAEAPDGTKYDVPDGKMDGYLGSVLLNAMAKALANPPDAHQAGDPVAELEQENRLMRARVERLEAERTTLLEALNGLLAYFESGNSVHVSQATIKASSPEVTAARAAIAKAGGEV